MKSPGLLISAAVVALATFGHAQDSKPAEHEHGASQSGNSATPDPVKAAAQKAPAKPKTEAQLEFDQLKQLAGEWQGRVSLDPPMKGMGDTDLRLTMRVTSRGNTITHEFQQANTPLDFTKYDHPITMIYIDDNDQLSLIHYCDAGNRPRMTAKKLPDGSIDFSFVDLTGPTKYGNMDHATFTPIDQDHHIQEWTFKLPGDKLMHAKMNLTRVTTSAAK